MPDTMLRKQYVCKASVDSDERTVTAVISTSGVDRDREVMLPKGALTENYMKNPVVLWAHNFHETPIGKAIYIDRKRKEIVAKVEFAETDKAEEVYQLFKGGFLNAFSIGFIPLKSHNPTPDEIRKMPEWAEAERIIDEWELLEFSPVPVPSNPQALAKAVVSKGVTLSEETLEELELEINSAVSDEPVILAPKLCDLKGMRKLIKQVNIRAVPRKTINLKSLVTKNVEEAKHILKGRMYL